MRRDLALRKLNNKFIVVDTRKNRLHMFNESGTFLLDFLSDWRSLEEIAGHLASEFKIEPEKARLDTGTFLKKLGRESLLETKEN